MRPRPIIHLNIADFAARLETMGFSSLKDRTVVIAPLGAPGAVAYNMNEPTFQERIRKRMPFNRQSGVSNMAQDYNYVVSCPTYFSQNL